jgi:hypothetical protein
VSRLAIPLDPFDSISNKWTRNSKATLRPQAFRGSRSQALLQFSPKVRNVLTSQREFLLCVAAKWNTVSHLFLFLTPHAFEFHSGTGCRFDGPAKETREPLIAAGQRPPLSYRSIYCPANGQGCNMPADRWPDGSTDAVSERAAEQQSRVAAAAAAAGRRRKGWARETAFE